MKGADMCEYQEIIDDARVEAMAGSGSSYEFYCKRFTRIIDQKAAGLPGNEGNGLRDAAKASGDYMTPEEEREAFKGCCQHGIEWGCCPAGCDDLEDWHDEIGAMEIDEAVIAELKAEEEQARLDEIAARDAKVLDKIAEIQCKRRGNVTGKS
ncbi:plasmid protein [Gluconacetobacter diazotrophicus]|nr:plasmid protein [Gluconacetobacter diazotrophicus]